MKQHAKKIIVLMSLIISAAVIIAWASLNLAAGATEIQDWPPFKMEYKEWSLSDGHSVNPNFQVVRVDYTDRRHWRAEILQDSMSPASIGAFGEISDDIVRGTGFNRIVQERKLDPSEGLPALSEWLIPFRIANYKKIPGATIRTTDTPNLMEITFTEMIPCEPETWKCETAVYTVVTSVKYWADTELPMGMTVTSNGELTDRKSVV